MEEVPKKEENAQPSAETKPALKAEAFIKSISDRHFLGFIEEQKSSFVVSSYKKNELIFIGSSFNKETRQAVSAYHSVPLSRPMGMCVVPPKSDRPGMMYIGSANLLWTYVENGSEESHSPVFTDYDSSYVPRKMNLISDIDCHDIVEDPKGQIYFVSALYCCVCKPSETHSFKVHWSPPWLSKIAAEDRCHLNGLCCDEDGVPRYVTSISRTDVRDGWRENRVSEGIVFDIIENKLICKGLSMPHSPRWNNGKLWILESGTGQFGYIDFNDPVKDEEESYFRFKPQAFIRGFLRGLAFFGTRYALVGSSLDRHEKMFQDIPLGEILKKKKVSPVCGVSFIDLKSFDVKHDIIFDEELATEIYDVCSFSGKKRIMAHNINEDKLLREHSFEPL